VTNGLPYGALNEHTAHLCIDMQTMFAERTDWHLPWMERVMPVVLRIARAHPEQTVLTRFVPPERPEEMPGSWRRFYQRWRKMTGEQIDPALISLVPEFKELAPPATVIDKLHYSPFAEPHLHQMLQERGINSLVVTGAETDVCVLAAVLDAVDLGYRVVVAGDGLCSASDETHDALMLLYRQRFSQQIEVATTDVILAAWT
jgi:nicotinamidase-related amidase